MPCVSTIPPGIESEQIDRRNLRVRSEIVRIAQSNEVDVKAGDEVVADAVGDPRPDRHAALIAPLRLVVDDAGHVGAEDAAGRPGIAGAIRTDAVRGDPAIAFEIEPGALGRQAIGLVADGDGVAWRPVDLQAGAIVSVADEAVTRVVVAFPGVVIEPAVDQRRTEVAHRPLIAIIVTCGDDERFGRCPAQRARDGIAAG